ncbi:hypothetical protein INT45_004008 [Circinella minor]|uniref:SH3 domain-containing protein n=1 Tax=Circinella minor TaxID=1195481 RepID=A0A8H7S197_9FUNG|nr:hypothetical protein INT45_004008 [Circinella minor]
MTVTLPRLFANNFWGKEDAGYDVLMHKMNMAKKTCDDLRSLYNAKASLHEDLGKKLTKQTKMELGREETGTIKMLLLSAQKEMEATAQANIELAQKIRSELELSMDNFILEQKDRRKLVQTNVDKAHRNKQLHTAHVTKAKEKYEAECAKSVSLENQLSQTTGFREMERIRQKFERSQNEIKTLEKEYKNACNKLANATTVWNNEWKVACSRFQDMEEKRIEFLHHSLCIYVNILSSASNQDQESYERFWKALDQCNANADIEQFINEKGTGPMIPEPPVYVDYNDDPAKTLPRYQVAQFTENDIAYSLSTPLTTTTTTTTTGTTTAGISSSNITHTNTTTNSVANMIKSTAKRSTSFCEPKRRTSTCLTKKSPSIRNHQQQEKREEQMVARLDHQRINLYASNNNNNNVNLHGKPKKPAPAKTSHHTGTDTQQDTDEAIDPRAEVVVAIGNNMFPVDHRHQTTSTKENKSSVVRSRSKRRSTTNSSFHDQADMEEAFSDSIKGLLKELGVHQQQPSSTTLAGDKVQRRKSVNQQQQQQRYSMNTEHHMNGGYVNTTTNTNPTPMVVNNNPRMITPTGIPSTTINGHSMIWARALYDYYSERPEDLSFKRGQWLVIIQNNDPHWWLAHKWDDTTGRLSETCGYVASNFVQIC